MIYLLLFGTFLLQEPISSGGVLLDALNQHVSVWIIHLFFIVTTSIDVIVGYYAGRYIERRFENSKFVKFCKRKAEELNLYAGRYGQKVMIVVFGQILFPISAIMMPWLEVSLLDSLIYLFLGELIFWYALLWLVVLGVGRGVTSGANALYLVLLVSAVVSVGVGYLRHRAKKSQVVPKIQAGQAGERPAEYSTAQQTDKNQ